MGIEGFYKWIKEEYSDSILSYNDKDIPQYFDHVYIDLNYLLHMCNYNSNNMTHTINKLKNIIMDITIKTQPTKSLNLFCDGVAPMAKLLEQRKRRIEHIMYDTSGDSTLNFTPGTIFLETLEEKLHQIIKIIKNQLCINIHIDIVNDGEGELKIKNKLLENYSKSKIDNHILVTTDADVVLMAMSNYSYKNTYILLKDNVLSLNKLLNLHTLRYGKSESPHTDFSFLNLFMGNDYIPKLKHISVNKIWNAYKQNLSQYKYLVNNLNELNNEFLIDIFTDVIANIKLCYYKKISLEDYDMNKIKNYLDGITWTYVMYKNGICNDYKYIYNYDTTIDPLSLQIFLFQNKLILKLNKNINNIDKNLCAILLLPKKGIELIDKKYHKFINNKELSILYEEENCIICKNYIDTYRDNKQKYENGDISKDIYNKFNNIYNEHKFKHKNLTESDINKIINKFNFYKKQLL